LLVILIPILMLRGVIPTWPHSRNWSYGPAGGLGLVLIIVIVLLVGRPKPVQIPRACRNAGTVTDGRNWMLWGRAG
jgi:NhaP-type Na+/H+ or K+/H+ antiporter